MKIINIKKYKLFKYNLLKLQFYKHNNYNNIFSKSVLEQTEISLKQLLKIIYEYHVNNSKILFIGFPVVFKKQQVKLVNLTNHDFISQKFWLNGTFRNRFSVFTYLKNLQLKNFSKSLNTLLTLKSKPHLVVFFDNNLETGVINEFYKAGIPVIVFNCKKINLEKALYKTLINLNFDNKNLKLTLFFFIYSILKKKQL